MSRNYIKVLLKPFRESRVVEALLKWLEPGGGGAVLAARGVNNEVNLCFCLNLFVMCIARLDRDYYFIIIC